MFNCLEKSDLQIIRIICRDDHSLKCSFRRYLEYKNVLWLETKHLIIERDYDSKVIISSERGNLGSLGFHSVEVT